MIWPKNILPNVSKRCKIRKAPSYHRQVVYWTTKLPNTGPMFNPPSSPNMYSEVPKLCARPGLQISLTMPDVMLARTPEQDPVMILVTTSEAKFSAKACGMMKRIITT